MSLTVGALQALSPGQKIAAGRGVHVRCNADGSLTATLRAKRAGKQFDLKAGDFPAPFNSRTISAIVKAAEDARGNVDKLIAQHVARNAKQEAPAPGPAKLKAGATLADVWASYRATVVKNNKWTARNLATNDHRVKLHLATWAAWNKPAANLDAADIAHHLAKLAKTPAQLVKVRGLLALMLAQAKRQKIISDGDLVKDARAELADTMPKQSQGRSHHALLELAPLRKLYKAIDQLAGSPSTRNALKLQALTAQRTGEVIGATWGEFDLDADVPTWTIPRSRMKVKKDNKGNDRPAQLLHLSTQAVAMLKLMRPEDAKASAYVFPGRPGEDRKVGHVTDNAISQALRRDLAMEGKHVPHGWRAAMKTLATGAADADGRPLFAAEWTESVLDHVMGDAVNQAYLRARLHAQAGKVLQWWGDQLTN